MPDCAAASCRRKRPHKEDPMNGLFNMSQLYGAAAVVLAVAAGLCITKYVIKKLLLKYADKKKG